MDNNRMIKYAIKSIRPSIKEIVNIGKDVSIRIIVRDDKVSEGMLAFIEPKSDTRFTLYVFENSFNNEPNQMAHDIAYMLLHEFRHVEQYITDMFPEMKSGSNVPYSKLLHEIEANDFADKNIGNIDLTKVIKGLNKIKNKAY